MYTELQVDHDGIHGKKVVKTSERRLMAWAVVLNNCFSIQRTRH